MLYLTKWSIVCYHGKMLSIYYEKNNIVERTSTGYSYVYFAFACVCAHAHVCRRETGKIYIKGYLGTGISMLI